MEKLLCRSCGRSIDEADRRWDAAAAMMACPFCKAAYETPATPPATPFTLDSLRLGIEDEMSMGLLFESEGTVLSSAEGFNHAACAVIGALVLNLGRPTFNIYCENQRRMLGWFAARGNPLSKSARDLRSRYRAGDPTAVSMFADVLGHFLKPILEGHRNRHGENITPKQEEALCAMFVAKVLWDVNLGNAEFGVFLRMLTPTGCA